MVAMSMVKTSTAETQTFTKIPYELEPRCDALLPNTLIVSLSGEPSDKKRVLTITKLDGSTFLSKPFSYDPIHSPDAVPGFNRVVSLENGLKAPALIFYQEIEDSPSRMDLFVDTESIGSLDPSNPDFIEKTICMIKFSTTALSSSSEKTVEPTHQHLSRTIDTCAFGGSSLISFEDASDCIQSVAFNQDQRKRTLDALDILADIYVYRDININSPGEDPVQVDLVEELKAFRNRNFESNYDFHDAVRKLFIRGRDTHTQYSIPVCYQQFSFFQPFSLYSTIDDNDDQVLVVSPRPNIPDESRYGFSPAAYDGHIVEEIDGKKAMDYYIKWVNKNVIDKQESNRFNAGLGPGTGKDLFCRRDAVIPENPFMTWTLVSPITNDRTTLEVPWLARTSLTNYNSNQFASLCLEENVERACGPSRKREETHLHHHELRSFNPNDVLDTIGTTSLVSFSRETGVLSVPSFELLDYSPFWISQSFTILYLEAIHRYHFNRLMIDVSNNGGGRFSAGLFLAGLLDKNQADILKVIGSDQIHSDFFDEAIEIYFDDATNEQRKKIDDKGFRFLFNRVRDQKNEFPNPPESWYTPGVFHTRGGKRSEYSNKVELNYILDDFLRKYLKDLTSSRFYKQYGKEQILVITNGLCYSSCSLFIRSFQQAEKSIILGYGGIEGKKLSSSDVPANVVSASEFTSLGDLLVELGFDDFIDNVPRPFPFVETCSGDGHSFQITLFESYAPGEDIPQEYTETNVNIRLNSWPKDQREVWSQADYVIVEKSQSAKDDADKRSRNPRFQDPKGLVSHASAVEASLISLVVLSFFSLFL